jgi:hypothetical protein
MRPLHRDHDHDDAAGDRKTGATKVDDKTTKKVDDKTTKRVDERTTDDGTGRRSGLLGRYRRREADDRTDVAARERDRAARDDATPVREPDEQIHMKRLDAVAFLTAACAVALGVVGGLALARTGVDDTWYSPVEQVAGVDHTAALGAVEVGAAVLVLIPLLFGLRMVAALVALAGGAVAAVAAIDPGEVSADLALERGWAVTLAAVGIVAGLLLVATRDRVKRIERRPRRHRLGRDSRAARPV